MPCERLGTTHLRGILSRRLWSLYRLFFWPNHLSGQGSIPDSWHFVQQFTLATAPEPGRASSWEARPRPSRVPHSALAHWRAQPWKVSVLRSLVLSPGTTSLVKAPQEAQTAKQQPQGKHPSASSEVEENEIPCILRSFVLGNNVLALVKQPTPGKHSVLLFPVLRRVPRVEKICTANVSFHSPLMRVVNDFNFSQTHPYWA